tara:strand:- start:387 stop:545 length:159 start_codon:yes stop_codon:yes gene_type:complete
MATGLNEQSRQIKRQKKTRQGMSRNTKLGHKGSKKHYIKKYRGQGGSKRSKA